MHDIFSYRAISLQYFIVTRLCVTLLFVASQNRNITFSLPEDLIREVKLYAAQNDTSLNAVVKDLLETLTEERRARSRAAVRRILEIADEGPPFDADPRSIQREDLYRDFDRISRKSDS